MKSKQHIKVNLFIFISFHLKNFGYKNFSKCFEIEKKYESTNKCNIVYLTTTCEFSSFFFFDFIIYYLFILV
jgi:hypothetical protein